jgi:hypothetical protein
MNLIKNIEIKNFKSIRHQKIEDCRRINVFVGYPNVGKSNILEALSLFSVDRPNADFSSFVRMEDLTTLFFDGNVEEPIEVRLNEDNRIVGEILLDKLLFHWQLAGEGASFDKMGPGIQQKIFDILNFEKSEGSAWITRWDSIFTRLARSTDFVKELGQGYLSSIKKYSFHRNTVHGAGKYDSLSIPDGNNIFDIIRTHKTISSEVKELFAEYNLELLYNSTEKKMSILKRINKDIIFTIPYTLVSDTLLRLIFYKAAIESNKESILLFEEPEAHMFPPYISKFTADVMYDNGGNQFFMATHSPFVINDFMENLKKEDYSIYVIGYKKETGETVVRRLTDEELHEIYQFGTDLYLNLENYLFHEQQ